MLGPIQLHVFLHVGYNCLHGASVSMMRPQEEISRQMRLKQASASASVEPASVADGGVCCRQGGKGKRNAVKVWPAREWTVVVSGFRLSPRGDPRVVLRNQVGEQASQQQA